MDGKRLLIIGAGGATGEAATREALARGHRVRAVEPGWPEGIEAGPGVELIAADLLADDLAPLMDGVDAVLSCIGLGLSPATVLDPPPLYTEGMLRTVRAMQGAGVRRLVAISASFVEGMDRGPVWFRAAAGLALGRVFRQMSDMERILRAADGIDWTAVRPGWLMDAPASGDWQVADRVIPPGTIRTRIPDLAAFMLDCVEQGLWIGGTPAIARAEPASAVSPLELLKEALG